MVVNIRYQNVGEVISLWIHPENTRVSNSPESYPGVGIGNCVPHFIVFDITEGGICSVALLERRGFQKCYSNQMFSFRLILVHSVEAKGWEFQT